MGDICVDSARIYIHDSPRRVRGQPVLDRAINVTICPPISNDDELVEIVEFLAKEIDELGRGVVLFVWLELECPRDRSAAQELKLPRVVVHRDLTRSDNALTTFLGR